MDRINITNCMRDYQDYLDKKYRYEHKWCGGKEEDMIDALAKLTDSAPYVILSTALAATQTKCKARTIETIDILSNIKEMTDTLEIAKSRMVGLKFTINPNAQEFANAYTYTPEATVFCGEVGKGGRFYITNIARVACGKKQFMLTLPEDTKAAIIERFERF